MSTLFSPLKLKKITLKNRIIVSPMCQYSADDGFASNWHLVHLGQFAIGGAAAIIQEATAVLPNGRITYADLGIWKDEHIEKLKEITKFIKEQNCIPGIQLAHAGRKASGDKPWNSAPQIAPQAENGWQTVAPFALAYQPEKEVRPHALSLIEIQELVRAFSDAALRAVAAGYAIIEIHAAHGYLIHQFLSPLSNHRKDMYGGSFSNRIRFLLDIIRAVKTVLQDQSLWVRLSASDWAAGGWDVEESIHLTHALKDLGVEVMDVSSAGLVPQQRIEIKKDYQLAFASKIKTDCQIVTGTVGLIKDAQHAEDILLAQKADLVFIGRAFLDDPHLPLHFAKALNTHLQWPNQYLRAK